MSFCANNNKNSVCFCLDIPHGWRANPLPMPKLFLSERLIGNPQNPFPETRLLVDYSLRRCVARLCSVWWAFLGGIFCGNNKPSVHVAWWTPFRQIELTILTFVWRLVKRWMSSGGVRFGIPVRSGTSNSSVRNTQSGTQYAPGGHD